MEKHMKKILVIGIVYLTWGFMLFGQDTTLEFTQDKWYLQGQVVDHLGQKSLMGRAVLKDVEFENGVIEVDMAFEGSRCFGMIQFRMQSGNSHESFYIRPHKSGQYDALQYTPVASGLGAWQLYSGEGFTAAAEIPHKRWVHIKLEVAGTQARVFLDHAESPALVIHELKHGLGKGGIGLTGPAAPLAHFANFSFQHDDGLHFEDPPPPISFPGMLREWELSQPFPVRDINREISLEEQQLTDVKWKQVAADATGLVDIGMQAAKPLNLPFCVLARTTISADQDSLQKLDLGYSDEVSVFLNGRILFRGNSEFQRRDPAFSGILGLNDAVFLPLLKGENELLLMVTEVFGGWGFMCRLGDIRGEAVYQHRTLTKLWEISEQLAAPESVCFDPDRDVLYLSNFGADHISKLALDGNILERKWATGLKNPTGMALAHGRLYVVERGNLVEIETATARVLQRHPIPDALFPNDVTIGDSGELYISDSQKNAVYIFQNNQIKIWLQSDRIPNPNGLIWDAGRLIVGTSGDGCIKAVNPENKSVQILIRLGSGAVMDGIQSLGQGGYLLGDWNGSILRVSSREETQEILNTMDAKLTLADFAYIPDKRMLVIPTLYGNRVLAFTLD